MMAGDFIKVIALTAALAALVTFLSWLVVKPAHGSAVCLTKKEARTLWPKQHLYWYSAEHCWSNRRGKPHNLRYDLIRENHAQVEPPPMRIAAADQTPATEKKSDPEPWPVAVKPIRVIEIIRPEPPLPATPVEEIELQPLPVPPASKTSILAPLAGAISAVFFAIFVLFSKRTMTYVERSTAWIHHRIGQARKQIPPLGAFARNIKPPVYHRNIREILRRVERRGHADHLTKILDSIENTPIDEWKPPDDSPLAHWARSIRAAKDS